MNELQLKLFEIAKLFHNICERNDIPYYMLGGTMLGAIRHKGFIPWDDDMDFGVMKNDFPRLIKALQEGLPSYYKIRTIDNSKYISNSVIKIEDSRYEIVEIEKENADDCIGLNIDVFPLSRTNRSECLLSRNWIAKQLIRLNWCRYLNYKRRGRLKFYTASVIKCFLKLLPQKTIPFIVESVVIPHKGDCITNYWDSEIVPENVMGTPVLYSFESERFFGVAEPHPYLQRLYGNYMEIPKRDQIHTHIVEFSKKI